MNMEVVAAILMEGGDVLCMQRKKGRYDYLSYKYEFPGGKVEAGESLECALERELLEEMDLEVRIEPHTHFATVEHGYPDFHLTLHCYLHSMKNREFTLKEHRSFQWLPIEKITELDWAEADWPVVRRLVEWSRFR